jgi:hypothetical protein
MHQWLLLLCVRATDQQAVDQFWNVCRLKLQLLQANVLPIVEQQVHMHTQLLYKARVQKGPQEGKGTQKHMTAQTNPAMSAAKGPVVLLPTGDGATGVCPEQPTHTSKLQRTTPASQQLCGCAAGC